MDGIKQKIEEVQNLIDNNEKEIAKLRDQLTKLNNDALVFNGAMQGLQIALKCVEDEEEAKELAAESDTVAKEEIPTEY